jgi:hypothetical protein
MAPKRSEVITLYEELLKLADKEQRAVKADNLAELEACLRRKEAIVEKLREAGFGQDEGIPPQDQPELNALIEKAAEAHEGVRNSVESMLDECRRAILGVRTGHQAHLAYQRSRNKNRERSAKVL